jgi:hypothetical protein
MLLLAADVVLAALEVGNNRPNTLIGTFGNDDGQDTLIGLGGRGCAHRQERCRPTSRATTATTPSWAVGGQGRIFTGNGFDPVFAFDGNRDITNCNGGSRYRIVFDRNLDRFECCPGVNSGARSAATSGGATQAVRVRRCPWTRCPYQGPPIRKEHYRAGVPGGARFFM